MKAVILDAYTVNPGDLSWESLKSICEISVYDRTDASEIVERIGESEAVFTSKCAITKEIIESCANLKFIGVLATGYDNIDLNAAKERNIAVCNVPAYSTEAVAQHTFALILEMCSNVAKNNEAVQQGSWSKCEDFCMVTSTMFQLSGKSLGIVGYGNIGKRVGQIAEAFGMTVIPYSRNPEEAIKADILTLHCPATDDNKGFINKDFIAKMKDGAYFVNTARGALVNEADLAEAVKCGKLAGAAVDVVSKEPICKENPLLGIPNLIITAHIAWTSREARKVICETSADNLRTYIEGGTLNRII